MKKAPINPENLSKEALLALLEKQERLLEKKDRVLEKKDKLLAKREQQVESLEQKLRIAISMLYGKRSEKTDPEHPYQSDLFNEADQLLQQEEQQDTDSSSDTVNVPAHQRKRSSGRAKLPEDLERRVIEHDLEAHEKRCECGCELKRIGQETSENLEVIPAQVYVEQHVRHKYACPSCEDTMKLASKPESMLPKSNAGAGLLAYITVAKYQDSLPLYRLSKIFERYGIELPRNTLARWIIMLSERLVPVIERFEVLSQQSPVILMDETTVQVNKEPGRAAESKSYMFVRRALSPPGPGGNKGKDITLFNYNPSRSSKVPIALLKDYQGALMTDGYEGYNAVVRQNDLQHAQCWAHARRKFIEAEKALPKGKKSPAISTILNDIQKLYGIEKRLVGKSASEKLSIRQAQAKPLLKKLKDKLEEKLATITPKSKFGEAIAYSLKRWESLCVYTDNALIPIDNNGAENAIRPFVVGRKNWIFADTPAGAEASARLYSLIETAKANGHEPYHYLKALFSQLPQATTEKEIDALMPWALDPQKTTR